MSGRTGGVAVVTDSTSYLPEGVAEELGVTIVPLNVIMGSVSGAEGVDVQPEDVVRALQDATVAVTTSRPSPAMFTEAYETLLAAGAEAVVSIHLSSDLSGTWDAARLGALDLGTDRVQVVDSRSVAMGMGFPVMEAARRAAAGEDVSAVVSAARSLAARTRLIFYVDTLDYLRRGGRISATSAALGSALSVKPLLHLSEGRIAVLEKVRTSRKALARIQTLAVEEAGSTRVDIAVHHLGSPVRAFELANNLEFAIPGAQDVYQCDLGAVIGAHTGPGVVGVVVSHR